MAKDNDNVLDTLLGITESPKETMSHASMLRNNLRASSLTFNGFE